MQNNIGCNIVDPLVNECADYTCSVYLSQLPHYRKLGFTHLEFSHLLSLSASDAGVLRQACRETGLIPWSVHSEHWNDGITLEEYLVQQEHCAHIADALDARVMVCHLPNCAPRLEDFQRDLAALTRLADITRANQVRLAIENCLSGDLDYILKIVTQIDRHDVGVNLDTGHAFLYESKDLAELIRRIGPHLFTTHLHDNFGRNDDHQAPGMGLIDWPETLQALQQSPYPGPLMLELTGPTVKKRRSVPELRTFDLEKEQVFAFAFLNHCLKKS